jgi:hypothetical protein
MKEELNLLYKVAIASLLLTDDVASSAAVLNSEADEVEIARFASTRRASLIL